MILREVLCMLSLDHEIVLLQNPAFSDTVQNSIIEYVYIASTYKEGIDTVLLVPVYVTDTKVYVLVDSEEHYIDYKFQSDAIQSVKRLLNIQFFEHKMMEFSPSTESAILSISKHTTYNDIEKIAAKYDAHVDSIINEVSNDSKFKDQAEPRSGPTFVMKLKQFFKTL